MDIQSSVTCAHEYAVIRQMCSWMFMSPWRAREYSCHPWRVSWISMSPVTYSWIFKLPCRVTRNIHITRNIILWIFIKLLTCILNIHITRHAYTESRPMAFQVKSVHRFNNRKYFYWLISRLTVWLGIFNCFHCFRKHGLLDIWVRQKYWIFRFYEENRPTVRTKHKHDPKC